MANVIIRTPMIFSKNPDFACNGDTKKIKYHKIIIKVSCMCLAANSDKLCTSTQHSGMVRVQESGPKSVSNVHDILYSALTRLSSHIIFIMLQIGQIKHQH